MVGIIVPVYNRIESTLRFLQSTRKLLYKDFKVIIIDDGSTDGTSTIIAKDFPEVILLQGNGNLWWSGATNVGVRYAIKHKFDYVLTINQDSVFDPNLINELIRVSKLNDDAIVGARIMQSNKTHVWALGALIKFRYTGYLGMQYYNLPLAKVAELGEFLSVQALPGDGVLIPVQIFAKIGLYNAKWCPQYHGDTEFTYRANKQGFKVLVSTKTYVVNDEFDSDPKFSIWDELFSKKSWHYWRPNVYFYAKYAPLTEKIFVIKQFFWLWDRLFPSKKH